MGATSMHFSRSAGNYVTYVTQFVGDSIDFKTTEAPSFPSKTKVTEVDIIFEMGLKSGSGNYRSTDIAIEFLCDGEWYEVWSGAKSLSGDGGDGTCEINNISIPYDCQKDFATYGIEKIRVLQDGSYAVKGMSTAYGSATFTYESDDSGDSGDDGGSSGDDEGDSGSTDYTGTPPSNIRFDDNPVYKPTVMRWSPGKAGAGSSITGYLYVIYERKPGYPTFDKISGYITLPADANEIVVDPPSSAAPERMFKISTRATTDNGSSVFVDSPILYYQAPTHPGEPLFSEEIEANKTLVKVNHIVELRDAINALREYYVLPFYPWTAQLTLTSIIKEWTLHVAELQAAINDMVETPVNWIIATENSPKKAIIDQLRNVLKSL